MADGVHLQSTVGAGMGGRSPVFSYSYCLVPALNTLGAGSGFLLHIPRRRCQRKWCRWNTPSLPHVWRMASIHTEAVSSQGSLIQPKEGLRLPQRHSTKLLGPGLRPPEQVRATRTTLVTLGKELSLGLPSPLLEEITLDSAGVLPLQTSGCRLCHFHPRRGKAQVSGSLSSVCVERESSPFETGNGGVNAKFPVHQRQPACCALAAKGCRPSSAARQRELLARRLSATGSNRR